MKVCKPFWAGSVICLFLLSCGIEQYHFLPQVPENRITRISNTDAEIIIPRIDRGVFDYARNYSIFYRIYISDQLTTGEITEPQMGNFNPSLLSDYRAIYPSTDQTNTSATTNVTTLFTNRNFFELEVDGEDIKTNLLSTNGGTLRIHFPTAPGSFPVASLNGGPEFPLRRSGQLVTPFPTDDPFFRNTSELSDPANATSNNNADVAGRQGLSQHYAYVSMYIVAAGVNSLFSPIYSKPTHISIFQLPDAN